MSRTAKPEGEREPEVPRAAPSDAALVIAARAKERWAQQALFLRHVGPVTGLAYRLFPASSEVEDLVQDVFVIAFETLDRLENPQAFASWVATIAVRQAHKRMRRRRIGARLGLLPREEVAFDQLGGNECPPDVRLELTRLYERLAELPLDERTAIVLRRVEGLSLPEIAQLTSASLATVKRRIARAAARLPDLKDPASPGSE